MRNQGRSGRRKYIYGKSTCSPRTSTCVLIEVNVYLAALTLKRQNAISLRFRKYVQQVQFKLI